MVGCLLLMLNECFDAVAVQDISNDSDERENLDSTRVSKDAGRDKSKVSLLAHHTIRIHYTAWYLIVVVLECI